MHVVPLNADITWKTPEPAEPPPHRHQPYNDQDEAEGYDKLADPSVAHAGYLTQVRVTAGFYRFSVHALRSGFPL